jgi:pseudaminic acid synthase
LEPEEFRAMGKAIKEVESALGKISYELTESMKITREFSRSLFAIKDIQAGESLTEDNVRSIRPGYGLHPTYLKAILNKKAKKEIRKGTPLSWDLLI